MNINTYGYLREAVKAHIDLDEAEMQDMNLMNRLPLYTNETLIAVSSLKPKYVYKEFTVISEAPVVVRENEQEQRFLRQATEDELTRKQYQEDFGDTYEQWVEDGGDPEYWPGFNYYHPEPEWGDDKDVTNYLKDNKLFLTGIEYPADLDLLAWADRKAWKRIPPRPTFDPEMFVRGKRIPSQPVNEIPLVEAVPMVDFMYTSGNKVQFPAVGIFYIPAKCIWTTIPLAPTDEYEFATPLDIFLCLPMYIAALFLQIDHGQRATAKRLEFEAALARVTTTDQTFLRTPTPTFV